MFARPILTDENAGISGAVKLRAGLGGGLRGVKGDGKVPQGAAPMSAKQHAGGSGPSKLGQQSAGQPRAVLGNLTNSSKTNPAARAGAAKPQAQPIQAPTAHVEQSAGKGWRAMENELRLQEEHLVQHRINRAVASASTWRTSPFFVLADEDSDEGSDSEAAVLKERDLETAIVLQLPSAAGARPGDENAVPLAANSRSLDASNLLPDVLAAPINLDFWSEDEDAALL